jgi:hypothetical protein
VQPQTSAGAAQKGRATASSQEKDTPTVAAPLRKSSSTTAPANGLMQLELDSCWVRCGELQQGQGGLEGGGVGERGASLASNSGYRRAEQTQALPNGPRLRCPFCRGALRAG